MVLVFFSFSNFAKKTQQQYSAHTLLQKHVFHVLSSFSLYFECLCVCVQPRCCRAGWPVGSPRCSPDEGVFTGASPPLRPVLVRLVPQERGALN